MEDIYYKKYLEYKQKYLELKGGKHKHRKHHNSRNNSDVSRYKKEYKVIKEEKKYEVVNKETSFCFIM